MIVNLLIALAIQAQSGADCLSHESRPAEDVYICVNTDGHAIRADYDYFEDGSALLTVHTQRNPESPMLVHMMHQDAESKDWDMVELHD